MSDDNWSLKGKGYFPARAEDGRIYIVGETLISKGEWKDEDKLYKAETIEILQEKIIEDIQNFQDDVLPKITSRISEPLKADKETRELIIDISKKLNGKIHELIEQINRRFGINKK